MRILVEVPAEEGGVAAVSSAAARSIRPSRLRFFCVELVLRLACYTPVRECVRDPFIWLDAAAIMPLVVKLLLLPFGQQAGGSLSFI